MARIRAHWAALALLVFGVYNSKTLEDSFWTSCAIEIAARRERENDTPLPINESRTLSTARPQAKSTQHVDHVGFCRLK